MKEYGIGMMAKSLAGHDKGKVYMISAVDADAVYLVDGKYRTLDRPKRKKKIHVQIDYSITKWIQDLLSKEKRIQDSDVIRAIREYGEKTKTLR
ncbi:MAG: 50S ribosomal protein L14 [Clostridia bacterium]|nr:50S ribosomal protein L14 [Clostridia bacterium]NCC42183.1 50S ribosomal protein L14 [Clostridia bacterium]